MLTHSKIIQDTMKNSGGTFRSDLRGRAALPANGYIVGFRKIAIVSIADHDRVSFNRDMKKYLEIAAGFAAGKNNLYVGTWVESGSVYIDVAEYVIDRSKAERLCLEREELTYWDIAKGRAIAPKKEV